MWGRAHSPVRFACPVQAQLGCWHLLPGVNCFLLMQWIHKVTDRDVVQSLAVGLQTDPVLRGAVNPRAIQVLAPLLVRRGIRDAESTANYLSPSLSHLH